MYTTKLILSFALVFYLVSSVFSLTLTINSTPTGMGTTTPPSPKTVAANAVTNITATANTGCKFVKWTTTGTGVYVLGDTTKASTTIKLTSGNRTVTANFKRQRNLTILITGAGKTNPVAGSTPVVDDNILFSISATPSTGFSFVKWEKISGSGSVVFGNAVLKSTTVKVTGGDATIQAICTGVGELRIFRYAQGNCPVDSNLILYVKSQGYNAIQYTFIPSQGNLSSTDMANLRAWMVAAKKYNFSLIPELQCVNGASKDTRNTYGDTNIQMNIASWQDTSGAAKIDSFGFASLAFDTLFEAKFVKVLDSVKAASTSTSYQIPYVHLLHDELLCNRNFAAAGGYPPRRIVSSTLDSIFLDSCIKLGNSQQTAFCKLLMSEIYRHYLKVRTRISSQTKVIIYGDVFDPMAYAYDSSFTKYSVQNTITTLRRISTGPTTELTIPSAYYQTTNQIYVPAFLDSLSGLTDVQKSDLRNNVVLMPWAYTVKWDTHDYIPSTTFSCFANSGFKFVFLSGIGTWPPNVEPPTGPAQADSIMYKCSQARANFTSNCLGFGFCYWVSNLTAADSVILKKLAIYNRPYMSQQYSQ